MLETILNPSDLCGEMFLRLQMHISKISLLYDFKLNFLYLFLNEEDKN